MSLQLPDTDRRLSPGMWEWFERNPRSNISFEIDGRPYQRVVYRRIKFMGRDYDTVQCRGTILFMRQVPRQVPKRNPYIWSDDHNALKKWLPSS